MILFQNELFLAVEKLPDTLSVPARFATDPRVSVMREWSEKLATRLWAIHRLDEEVGGVLLFAKTAESHRLANQWFEAREVKKTYEALTLSREGLPEPGHTVTWRSRLLRGKKRAYEKPFGKDSITKATYVKDVGEKALWTVEPLTGRAHQIRFEFAKQGYPIWGDELYGDTTKFPGPGIGLRAVELDFTGCSRFDASGLPVRLKVPGLTEWLKNLKT